MNSRTSTVPMRRDRRGLSLATRVAIDSRTPSVFEALDSLASQLLALGWIVRMPRTAWDCQAGVLSVSARAFRTHDARAAGRRPAPLDRAPIR